MAKMMFFSMFFSMASKSKNFFILLLSMEMGVLSLLFFSLIFPSQKFIFLLFCFVMGSIVGLVMFMAAMKAFSSYQTGAWYF